MKSPTASRIVPYHGARKDLYMVGEVPPLGHIPSQMHAWIIRRDRHGIPVRAMQVEIIDTPAIDSCEVLVMVMAAGVNYNDGPPLASLSAPLTVMVRPIT